MKRRADLNTYENAVAPTNIPKIIAPVNADLSVTSFKTLKFNLLFKTASKIEPKAPTPAAFKNFLRFLGSLLPLDL